MVAVEIIMDGEGAFPDLTEKEQAGKLIKDITGEMLVAVAALDHGTSSGAPAVILRIDLPDGTTILTQTTMRLFFVAAAMFRAKYGDDL